MVTKNKRMYAIIHIGSMALSLRIVSYSGLHQIEVVQEAKRTVGFGEEVFRTGGLSFTSMRQMCRVLNGFRRIMADYRCEEVAVYATAVLREAENRRMILDLIRVHTGLKVSVLDMPQEIYFKHFALYEQLTHPGGMKERVPLQEGTLFVDITSGALGFTVWQDQQLCYQQNVHIGTLRILEYFDRQQRESIAFPDVMQEYLRRVLAPLWPVLSGYDIRRLVLSGRESRLVAKLMGIDSHHDMVVLSPERFGHVFREWGTKTISGLVQETDLTETQAEVLLPTLYLYAEILAHVPVAELVMMSTTFLAGATMFYSALTTDAPELADLREQHLALAKSIALRYGVDAAHVQAVADYAAVLLHTLRPIHGLDERAVYLLQMAAFLYPTGRFVNVRNSYEHTYHIIMGTDIFGLSDLEKEIVATVAYYRQKRRPSDRDIPFQRLPETAKMIVMKLAAILRLAQAMDRGELQKIKQVHAVLDKEELRVMYTATTDTTLEQWAFREEAALFTDIFGISAKLERSEDEYSH